MNIEKIIIENESELVQRFVYFLDQKNCLNIENVRQFLELYYIFSERIVWNNNCYCKVFRIENLKNLH